MMKKITFLFLILMAGSCAHAQVANTGLMDTASFTYQGKVTVEGYIDTYYSYDFNRPQDGNRPYFVSMSRHNELTVNLGYVDIRYSSSRLRARFVPGFGTYVNANYVAELGSLKNVIEASAGIKIFPTKNIWVDIGVFGSPYTNESAISKDHLAYTRSFAPEYVPYYLSGLKLSVPLSQKVNAYLYLLNGWQQIVDQNKNKSIGTQIEFRPTEYLLINWDTYVGNEASAGDATVGLRTFSDVYFILSKGKWSATGCYYIGKQEQESGDASWWQANVIGRYAVTEKLSVTGRYEYFEDNKNVQIVAVTPGITGFQTSSASLGLNYKLAENILLRLEGRTFFSDKKVYLRDNEAVKNSNLITSNITIWF